MTEKTYTVAEATDEQKKYIFDEIFREADEDKRTQYAVYVAVEDGIMIGRILGDAQNSLFLYNLYVEHEHRRRGVGTALFRTVEEYYLMAVRCFSLLNSCRRKLYLSGTIFPL